MFPVIVKFDEGPYTLDIYNIVAAGSVESDIGRVGNMPVVVGDRASATTTGRRAFFPTVAEKADDHQYDNPYGDNPPDGGHDIPQTAESGAQGRFDGPKKCHGTNDTFDFQRTRKALSQYAVGEEIDDRVHDKVGNHKNI